MASFWTAEEVMPYTTLDASHWSSELNNNERTFLSAILAFFSAHDSSIAEIIAQQFFAEVQIPEARCFYGLQIMMYGQCSFRVTSDSHSHLGRTYTLKHIHIS